MSDNLINFKYGILPTEDTLSKLNNGTIGLVQYDETLGYFAIKINGKLCDVLPPPCDIKGLPFLGQGSNVAPAYSDDLWISSITFFDKNKDNTNKDLTTIKLTDSRYNWITINCPSPEDDDAGITIDLWGYNGGMDISQSDNVLGSGVSMYPGYSYIYSYDDVAYSDLTISEDIYFWVDNGYYQMTSTNCEFTLGDGNVYEYSVWETWDLPLSIIYNKEGEDFNNILLDSDKIALSYNNEENDYYNNSKILLNNNQINLQYYNTTDDCTTSIDLTKSLTLSYMQGSSINNSLIIAKDQFTINAINNSLTITENQFTINTTNNSIILNESEDDANIQLKAMKFIDLYIGGTGQVSLTSTSITFNNKIIISTNSYGTEDPSTTGAVAGQVYFKILSD